MTDKETTKGELTAEERKTIGYANCKPLGLTEDTTEEERQRQHEIHVLGGKARAEQRRKAKNLKEVANMLLDMQVSRGRAKAVLGEIADSIPDDELTNSTLLMARMLNEVYENGTAKSAEFIRDTSGQKPQTELAVDLNNTMTEADRSLVANMSDVLAEILNQKK